MKLKLIRHLWGVTGSWEETFPRFAELGFTGIEAPLPAKPDERRFRKLLDQHGFAYIPQIFSAGADAAEHARSFTEQLRAAADWAPLLVNAHSGLDAWDDVESCRYFEAALEAELASGTPVAHETHRGRILFNPWVTERMLDRFPDLRLCCDFSHWVCVAERLLDDQMEAITKAAEHCIHLHARVGHEQGPQVSDPRAPEYAPHLAAHERWWRTVWTAQLRRGDKATTLTPEFGPPGYLQTLPHTRMPLADLWETCHWQAARQADQFAAWKKAL